MSGRWENWEEGDFFIRTRGLTGDPSGPVWLGLVCSVCGDVQATAEGQSTDLGYLSVAAQRHYELKHGAK